MTKKYYSTDEFYYIDPATKENVDFTGYVIVSNGSARSFETGTALIPKSNYVTNINLSNEYFDRVLDYTLELPYKLEDCTFATNDFLKSSVINKIINNIESNSQYLFRQAFISQNTLPSAPVIQSLSPCRREDDSTGIAEYKEVLGWRWGSTAQKYQQNIWNKDQWDDSIEGYNWDFTDVVDAAIAPTNKLVDSDQSADNIANKLFAIFIARKTDIQLMNLYLYPTKELYTEEVGIPPSNEPNFVKYSLDNNQNTENPETNHNLNLLTFSGIDPNNPNSVKFKNITSITLLNNELFVVDSELNGIFKYDVSRCLSNRGVSTNQIYLVEQLQGLGTLEESYLFDRPSSISSYNGIIAILDKGNVAVKVYDRYFNHKFTLSQGTFVRQSPEAVTICPYDFIINGQELKAGSIWILSNGAGKFSIDVYDKNGNYITNKTLKYLNVIKKLWYDTLTGEPSSPNPIYLQEKIKKVEFSYNNSNYYYIITDQRIIKVQLSQFIDPIGVLSYYYRSLTLDTFVWQNTYQTWVSIQDLGGELITWDYDRTDKMTTYPVNKCYAITGVPELNSDIVFNIIDNRVTYTDGQVHRVDNFDSNKKLYLDKSKKVTYEAGGLNKPNEPIYAWVGEKVQKYEDVDGVPTPVTIDNKPVEIEIPAVTVENDIIVNTALFYEEPNELVGVLLSNDANFDTYSIKDIAITDSHEYYSAITFNKILYKLYHNLSQIKNYIGGAFVGGYSVEGIMTFDHIATTNASQSYGNNIENFTIGSNENTSIVLNRCFTNLYNIQVNILKLLQTQYISSLGYNLNSYQVI